VNKTRSCKYSLDAPDDERYRSKHVGEPRNKGIINYPTQLHLVGHFIRKVIPLTRASLMRCMSFLYTVCPQMLYLDCIIEKRKVISTLDSYTECHSLNELGFVSIIGIP